MVVKQLESAHFTEPELVVWPLDERKLHVEALLAEPLGESRGTGAERILGRGRDSTKRAELALKTFSSRAA